MSSATLQDMQRDVGIYIMSYPGDFHLALALIRSIRHFHPEVLIMIIPGEGFSFDDHPFDVPIMPVPNGFWGEVGHQDRDFWAFQGPFEKFLYLDADIILTKPIGNIFEKLRSSSGRFLLASVYHETELWRAMMSDPSHPQHSEGKAWVRRGLGNPEHLVEFDPNYSPYGRCPFNSGVFASKQHVIIESDFELLHRQEVAFYRNKYQRDFSWKSSLLFYRDQGHLNYLADKLGLRIVNIRPEVVDAWAGDIVEPVSVEKFLNGTIDFCMIHWAGTPRPSPSFLCNPPFNGLRRFDPSFENYRQYCSYPEIPGYRIWLYFQRQKPYKMDLLNRITWTARDLRMLTATWVSQARAAFSRILSRHVLWRFRGK